MLVTALICIILVLGCLFLMDDKQVTMIEWEPEYGPCFKTRASRVRFDNGEFAVVMLSHVVPVSARGGSMIQAWIPLDDEITINLACNARVLGSSMTLVLGVGVNDVVVGTFTTNGKQQGVGSGIDSEGI